MSEIRQNRAALWPALLAALIPVVLLAACSRGPAAATATTGPSGATPASTEAPGGPPASSTPAPAAPTDSPTATPEPAAALVNGEPIRMADWEAEVARCLVGREQAAAQAATAQPAGATPAPPGPHASPEACPADSLSYLIERRVAAQAATRAGLAVSPEQVDAALAEVEAALGGPDGLAGWLAQAGYTPEAYRAALAEELLAAQAAERAAAEVGPTAEQAHARMILVANEEALQAVQAELAAGTDFAEVALSYSRDLASRAAGGDLGWFPRGVLTVKEVETAAFTLAPGETSEPIASPLGWHVVQVIERDPVRPLSPASLQTLRAAAYRAWLGAELAEAQIERFAQP